MSQLSGVEHKIGTTNPFFFILFSLYNKGENMRVPIFAIILGMILIVGLISYANNISFSGNSTKQTFLNQISCSNIEDCKNKLIEKGYTAEDIEDMPIICYKDSGCKVMIP